MQIILFQIIYLYKLKREMEVVEGERVTYPDNSKMAEPSDLKSGINVGKT